MTTAIDLITDSLRLANIIDANDVPTAEQGVSGLRSLNDLLKDWQVDGIRLGWQTVSGLDDVLPLREEDMRAVKFNFALELAGEYGIEPTPRVTKIADDGYSRLAKTSEQYTEASFDHLPDAEPFVSDGSIWEP